MPERLDRKSLKENVRELLETAQVSPKGMTALFLGLGLVLHLIAYLGGDIGLISTFLNILTRLLSMVLLAGFILYCMAIRRGERAEYLTLFDGFGVVGKLVLLELVTLFLIFLWSLLFVIPGIVAAYQYRFARFNLLENPDLGVMEALRMSKRQTYGYKWQLFMLNLSYLGWILLASVPSIVYNGAISYQYGLRLSTLKSPADLWSVAVSGDVFGIPVLVWQVSILLWDLVVALFYYPNWRCVELDYFAAAQRTSGVYAAAESGADSPWWDGGNE